MARKAGMATGVEVARISVKVSPDTRQFRRELQNDLNRIEREVKGNVEVDVDANTGAAEAKIDKASRDRKTTIKVDTDDRGWQKKLIDRARELRKTIIPNNDNERQRDLLRGVLDDMKRYGTFKNDLGPDARVLRARWNAALNEIEAMTKTRKVKVDVELNVDKNTFSEDFKKALAKLREGVTPSTSGGGGGNGLIPGMGGKSKFLPRFGTGFNAAAYGVIATLLLDVIAPAVGIVSTGLMTLPGLFTSLLVPIGAVALGVNGIKEAALEAGLTDTVTGKKGKKKTVLGDALKELQKSTNEAFKTGLTPVFTDLIKVLDQDKFRTAFAGVATGLSEMAKGFSDSVSSVPGMENINKILQDIGTALSNIRPGIKDFTDGLLQLIQQFTSGPLQSFTEWFNGAGKSFKDWIAEISANGKLEGAFKSLGDVLKVVVDFLGQLGKKGIDFMSNPEGIQTFISQLKDIAGLLERIVDASASFNRFLGKFDWVGDIAKAFSSSEGDKAFGDQAISQKLFGGLGFNFEQQIRAGFGDEKAKQYLEKFYSDQEQQAGEAGSRIGLKYVSSYEQKLNTGAGAGLANASRERRGLAPVPVASDTIKTPEVMKLEPPDTTEAMAAINNYKTEAIAAIGSIKDALKDAGNVQPPNLDGFSAAFDGIPDVARGAMDRVTGEIQAGGNAAAGAATEVSNQIANAFRNSVGAMAGVGMEIDNGLAQGIYAGQSTVIAAAVQVASSALKAANDALGIKSPSREFMKIGDQSMQGMAVGMENGIEPVIAQAKDLATKVADAFASGGDPTGNLDGFTNKEVSRMEKVLNFESKRLGIQAKALDYQAKTTGNDALKAQADMIRGKKEELDLQKSMLDLTQEYADLNGAGGGSGFTDRFVKNLEDAFGIPLDFMKSTGKQFLSDFGIEGGGALSTIADYGMKLGTNFVFNVSNIDEAMKVQNNQVNKQAMGMVGR